MRLFLIGIISIISFQVFAQNATPQAAEVNWMTMNQAIELQKAQPKMIFVDMYTDWCGWCTKMDNETFHHQGIVQYLNQNFYAVKFDAEGRDSVMYKDSLFVSSGPISDARRKPAHNFAKYLLNGRLSYPTIVFIDEDFNHYPVGGFRDVPSIEPLLIYFAERIIRTANYQDFESNFNKTFRPVRDSVYPELEGKVNWIGFDELSEAMQKEPKKIMLHIYHEDTRGSMVMTATSFTNPVVADYINESYYALKLNVVSTDSVSFLGQKFGNQQQTSNYPHDLALALLQNNVTVPATIFLGEDLSLIYAMRGYAAPITMELYLAFIKDNLYKGGDNAWAEFVKTYQAKIQK